MSLAVGAGGGGEQESAKAALHDLFKI